jgi:hypothetical protein
MEPANAAQPDDFEVAFAGRRGSALARRDGDHRRPAGRTRLPRRGTPLL